MKKTNQKLTSASQPVAIKPTFGQPVTFFVGKPEVLSVLHLSRKEFTAACEKTALTLNKTE